MAQEYIKFRFSTSSAWETIKQPDEGLQYSFETTYTEDSKRLQSGVLNMKPMFTVQSFGYAASDLTKAQMKQILKFAASGKKFYMHYFSPTHGEWRDDVFYVGQGSLAIGRLKESGEAFDSLSFNIIGVNPIRL